MKNSSSPDKVTIKEVAQRAGVSTATVSRVLSGVDEVSGDLQNRVLEAVQALNYHPNQLGRNLRRQATNIIGFLVTDFQNPFFTSVMRGIQDVLHEKAYVLLTANSDENLAQEKLHLNIFRAQGVAGIIFTPSQTNYSLHQNFIQGLPTVAVDRRPLGLSVDSVTVDNFNGVRVAIRHLVEKGYHRIGFIAGLPQTFTALERLRGYQVALEDARIGLDRNLIQEGFFSQEGGRQAMNNLLDLPEPPTAVLTANNLMTLGALQVIHERCMKIPDDIAVVGFDDMPWAASLQPPLTVIEQPTYDIGRTAASLLLERLNNPELPFRDIVLETKLIVRASLGDKLCV
jgi:LacI family transcriptional regulator